VSEYGRDWDWYADLIDSRKESTEWEIIRRARETHWEEFCRIRSGEKVLMPAVETEIILDCYY